MTNPKILTTEEIHNIAGHFVVSHGETVYYLPDEVANLKATALHYIKRCEKQEDIIDAMAGAAARGDCEAVLEYAEEATE